MKSDLSWGSPDLQSSSDSKIRASYRLLQSWYRETHLGLAPGADYQGKPRGSMLPVDAPDGANFLHPAISTYVEQRIPEVHRAGGTLDANRVRRNMLSSMPLCFNLFGFLRAHRDAAARVLSKVFTLDIAQITHIEVEWAPPPEQHLRDRTAFDAFIEYRRADAARGFIGVEAKYTESFSSDNKLPASGVEVYRSRTTALVDTTFKPGAADRLAKPATSQLWRNALLALSLRAKEPYDEGFVAVIALAHDKGTKAAVEGLRDELLDPDTLLRATSFDALLAACDHEDDLAEWVGAFRTRYLDLTPIKGA